ncbi:MAG TPA: YlaH-like family protein [Bacillales bacterium]|nr:YlaH-like family protein [Bacillales bacterium]
MNDKINPDFSYFAELYGAVDHFWQAYWLLYATIVILSVIVYKLGFAKKLPVLKSAVVYAVLLVGNLVFAFFAIGLPIVGCLIVLTVVFGGYKVRLHRSRKDGEMDQNEA